MQSNLTGSYIFSIVNLCKLNAKLWYFKGNKNFIDFSSNESDNCRIWDNLDMG